MNTQESVTVFTDGGCSGNPGPGGWAFVLITPEGIREYSGGTPDTTNNRMELTAVINALKTVNGDNFSRDVQVEMYTDSQYVRNGITSWIHNWERNGWKTAAKKPVKNKELWQELKRAAEGLNVHWHWVKGHAGNTHNERCDALVQMEMKKLL